MGRINITEIRRNQIVDAAVRVMARHGWNDTSIDEITREAGVSRGLVSYHFKDKSDLLSGVLARCQEIFNDAVAAAGAGGTDRRQAMRLVTRAAIFMARDDPTTYEVFLHFSANGRAVPQLGDEIRRLWGGFRHFTAVAIRAGQEDGSFAGTWTRKRPPPATSAPSPASPCSGCSTPPPTPSKKQPGRRKRCSWTT